MNTHFILLRITMKNGLIIECRNGYFYRDEGTDYLTVIEPQEQGYRPYKITEIFVNEILIMEHTERK